MASQKVVESLVGAKVQPKEKVEEVQSQGVTYEQIVDSIGKLSQEVAAIPLDPRISKLAKMEAELLLLVSAELEQEGSGFIEGEHYTATIGPCALKPRTVENLERFYEIVGHEAFFKLAKVNVSDVEKYCTPDQCAEVISQEVVHTTKRALKVKPLE